MAIPALNPDEPDFTIETAALGRIDALPITIGRLSELEKAEAETSTAFMNALIAIIARNNNGVALTDDDVAKLSDSERDEFARELLDRNQYLYRNKIKEEHQDDEGRTVLSFRDGNIKHQKEEGESDSDYLFRLMQIQKAELQEQTRRMMKPFEDVLKSHKNLFTPSFLDAFKKSQSATAQLGDMIKRLRIDLPNVSRTVAAQSALDRLNTPEIHRPELRIPDLGTIRNPVHDTNERLSDVVSRLDSMEGLTLQMAETVQGVSESASQFLVAFGAASDKADHTSRRTIWIAGMAIIVAVFSTLAQIGYSEWRDIRDQSATTAAIEDISGGIEAVVKVQRESMGQLGAELNNGNSALKDSFDRLSTAIEALNKSLRAQSNLPTEAQD